MHFRHLAILIAIPIFAFALQPAPVVAQVAYTVTPRVIDVSAESRDIISRTIRIENTGIAKTGIFPTVNEITVDAGGDIVDFQGPAMVDRTSAVTSWIELPRKEIAIMPGERYELPLTIRMNPNTEPGEYHALLGFGSGRTRADAARQVELGRAPTIVVTIRVEDTKIERVDLKGFRIEKFITDAENNAIAYTLENPGDTTVVPQGEVIIYDGNGGEVASVPANPDGIALAPGESVELTTSVPTSGLIGQYKGFLNVSYGAAQTGALYDTVFFYVLPWQRLLLVFGIIAAAAVFLTVILYRRYGIADDDEAHRLEFHVRNEASPDQDHDINLKRNQEE